MYFVNANANASFFLCRVVVVLLTTTKQNANSGLENQDIFRKGMKDYWTCHNTLAKVGSAKKKTRLSSKE